MGNYTKQFIPELGAETRLDTAGEHAVAAKRSEILWQRLTVPADFDFRLDSTSQMLLDGTSAGPVAGFILPGNRGSIDIELESFVSGDLTFYAPSIVILNSKNKVIYQGSFADFAYDSARLMDNDKFSLSFNIIPDMSGEELKMLIYTTAEDVQTESEVLHPAKAYAMAKHTQPPDIPNPVAKHSLTGNFRLSVKSNSIVNTGIAVRNDSLPAGADLKGYYVSAIKKAVEQENIPKAISLMEEAKDMGIEGAQEAFVTAVNNAK